MIDSHFHIWNLARGDYGWLTPDLKPIYRDVTLQDWRTVAEPCGIKKGILVQAAPTHAETNFLLEQAELHRTMILGVVGWVDMMANDARDRIEQLASNKLLLGIRPMLHDIPDPKWILSSEISPVLNKIAQIDLTFDALIRPVHFPHILEVARQHPNLRIVIDHGAKPDIATDVFDDWARDVELMARSTKAFCKLSGLLTEAGRLPDVATVARYINHLLVCFGPERLLWGSDWPVLELAADYRHWNDMAKSIIPVASHADVFQQTALRAYGLPLR